MIEHVSLSCTCEGKQCTKCKEIKCVGGFHRSSWAKSGLNAHCKVCRNPYNNAKRREKYWANPEAFREQRMAYYHTHREQEVASMRRRYCAHVEQRRAYARVHTSIYQKLHIEQVKAAYRARYLAHYEEMKARSRDHPYRLSEKAKETRARWIRENYEHYKAQRRPSYAKRRTLKTMAGGSYTREEWEALCTKYDYSCVRCKRQEPAIKLTADHVIPVSLGGTSDISNIQPLCKSCNSRKHVKVVDYRPDWGLSA